ncbi:MULTISPECIES: cupin domain-containing protein [unclassified Pseudofrankia]|uniref:cupin domain-containing protein n=1 Tax=unclassified Pseudofrankia TaxID=2994372 RepID=UPI0008DABC80|nr:MULTISPECIES: cupin domain-containing protein [unclassified Pseudofrankia]MDT3439206.1 cupin domain-containing protein [Pseudofrankia sp. BMG5.37]OHV43832.1 cupin [Pseudofrankia sp. BMG5.36]
MADEAKDHRGQDRPRQFFFDVNELEGRTNVEKLGESAEAERFLELLGRDLVTRTILQSASLSVYHETAKPGERVKSHRHGTHQLNYILRGELIFGRRTVGPGMGFYTPDMLYSWRAGDEGAEWIEIHSGEPGIFTQQRPS